MKNIGAIKTLENTEYLLSISEEWLQYAIRRNLLKEKEQDLAELKRKVLQDPKIKSLLEDVADFHGTLVKGHKNPALPLHKLLFLLDIGFDRSVPEIQRAVNEILENIDNDGVYQSKVNIPIHYGGSGEDVFGWSLCDAPLLLLALAKAGVDYGRHIRPGIDHLVSLRIDKGFPCASSREIGTFRGPGRKGDCCPYATLIMLKLFSEIPWYQSSSLADASVESLLTLWETSLQSHPYMFFMGTDFRKMKAPALWYDIISVADVLSRFEIARKDLRFGEMLAIIKDKQGKDGLFTPESIYLKCQGWDFGQKKSGSPYLTYLCLGILQRCEE